VIAALSTWHEQHRQAAPLLATITSLPAHALTESYSVLTRLPGGRALPACTAAALLAQRFNEPSLRLDDDACAAFLATLSASSIRGGATYDGLIGLEASTNGHRLLTLDRRAAPTYRLLGVQFDVIGE